MKREKGTKDLLEGPLDYPKKVIHREKQLLPPISVYNKKPGGLRHPYDGATYDKVKKKGFRMPPQPPPPPPPPPPVKTKTANRKDNPSKLRPENLKDNQNSRPRVKRQASKSVPPLKLNEKEKQRNDGKIPPPRRSKSQPSKKVDASQSKIAWNNKKKHRQKPDDGDDNNNDDDKNVTITTNPRPTETRVWTGKTRRTVVFATSGGAPPTINSSASGNTSGIVADADACTSSPDQLLQLSAREIQKRKVKKIVDYVYTMDRAYGSIASKFTRISLNDDEQEDVRRHGRTPPRIAATPSSSRMTSRSRVGQYYPYRGLTSILSGRGSVMSDYSTLPKTPKLMYGSLLSLRR